MKHTPSEGIRLEPHFPWMLSVTLVVAVETLSLTLGLGPRESQVLRCVEMTGITLLLAIRSHWVNDRGAFNLVSLGTLMPAAWLASRLLCGIYRIAPLATVSLAVPSYSAWRYAPDQGQSGALWPIRMSLRRGAFVLMASTAALLVLPGCSQKKEASPAPTASGYDLKGVIVTVDAPHHSLVVHHEDIPGYMPSMTMDFPVPDADLSSFKEGQQIAARMVIDQKGDPHLEGVRVLDPLKSGIVAASEASLQQETLSRGNNVFRDIGETAPQFTLLDQDNNVVSAARFKGRKVILNFIYTRCPVASMCPASTAKMMALQAAVKKAGIPNVELVSITLDPEYDTPSVLKSYAKIRSIDTSNFTFLTGPEGEVRNLLLSFGVLAEKKDNLLKHTLATVLIDETGVIRYRAEGSGWTSEEFMTALTKPLERK